MPQDKMIIDEQIVAKTAKLARLELGPDEIAKTSRELEEILEHFARLEKIDTAGVTPAYHPFEYKNQLRDDIPVLQNRQQDWLDLAGEHKDGYLLAPRTVED